MAVALKQKRGGSHNPEPNQIKCFQVNLQHSRAATANLMQLMSTDKIGMALIQEPHHYQNKLTGITKGYRIFAYGEGKCRAAIKVQYNRCSTDHATIRQRRSSPGNKGKSSFYAASIYFDIKEPIANNIKTVDRILKFTKGKRLLLAMDSNSRSTTY